MTLSYLQRRSATRLTSVRADRRHKFVVGQAVRLLILAKDIRTKELEKERETARFEITRLLPEQDHSFHYRIMDTATGRERVVSEDQVSDEQVADLA